MGFDPSLPLRALSLSSTEMLLLDYPSLYLVVYLLFIFVIH